MNLVNKRLLRVLSVLLTIAIFYAIFKKIDYHEVVNILINASPRYLWLSLLLMFFQLFIQTKRWQYILKTLGRDISFSRCLYTLMATIPVSSITPSKTGDVLRAVYLRDKLPVGEGLGSLLTERLLDMLLLSSLAFIGLLTYKYHLAYIAGGIFIGIIGFFFFISSNNLRNNTESKLTRCPSSYFLMEQLRNITLASRSLIKNKYLFLLIVLYTLLFWLFAFGQVQSLFYAVYINVPLDTVITRIPIAILIGLLPITISGMGIRDGAILLLFSEFSEPSKLLSASILFLVYRYWIGIIIGLPFMYTIRFKYPKANE